MRTDDLIVDLAGRVTPVRPLPPPGRRAMSWFLLAAGCGAAGVWFFGARPDVMIRIAQLDYLLPAILALATSAFAIVTTLVLAIPGAERTPLMRRMTVLIPTLWAMTMGWAVLDAGLGLPITADRHWPACFARAVVVTVVPLTILFVMVRRAAPLRLGWTAGLAATAAASVAALAVQLVCPLDDAGHAFLGHFVPVAVIIALSLILRRTLVGVRIETLRHS